jgi:hypothetical protein
MLRDDENPGHSVTSPRQREYPSQNYKGNLRQGGESLMTASPVPIKYYCLNGGMI